MINVTILLNHKKYMINEKCQIQKLYYIAVKITGVQIYLICTSGRAKLTAMQMLSLVLLYLFC